jgi:hypothetical protein
MDEVFLLLFVHKKKTLPAPCLFRVSRWTESSSFKKEAALLAYAAT